MKRILCLILLLAMHSCLIAQTRPHWVQLAGKPFVDVREYGAKGDGVTDDTAAIQLALDTETRLSFPNGFTFKVMDSLSVTSDNVYLLGLGGTVVLATSSKRLFDVTGDNFVADGMVISGPEVRFDTAPESTYGFYFENLDGAVVRNCHISWLTYGVVSVNASNVLLTQSTFENNLPLTTGAAGYGFLSGGAGSIHQTVSECSFDENRHAIYFSSGSRQCKAVNNTIIDSWSTPISVYTKDAQDRSEGIFISGNTIRGKEASELASIQHGIEVVENVGNVTITDNHISNVACYGVWLETNPAGTTTVSDVLVSNNHIRSCILGGIHQQRCMNVTVSNNFVYDTDVALWFDGSTLASPTQVLGPTQFFGNTISSSTIPLSISGGDENLIGPVKIGQNYWETIPANIASYLISSGKVDMSALETHPIRLSAPGATSTTITLTPSGQPWGSRAQGFTVLLAYSNGPITGNASSSLTIGSKTYPPVLLLASGSTSVFDARVFSSISEEDLAADALTSFTVTTDADFGPIPGTFTAVITPIRH